MNRQSREMVWVPVLLTLASWMGLIFAIDALVNQTWADLIGLFYLIAAPYVYRGLKAIVRSDSSGNTTRAGSFRPGNVRE